MICIYFGEKNEEIFELQCWKTFDSARSLKMAEKIKDQLFEWLEYFSVGKCKKIEN